MATRDPTPSIVADSETVPAAATTAPMRAANSEGTSASCSPKKSRICVLAISTAIPFVNPITTGRGRYLTAVPIPLMPRMTSITPAIIVTM